MSEYRLNILHLYPDLLNLYGDKGNIEAMKRRLLWRNIDVEVNQCTSGNENIDFENTDIIFLGGGSDREEEIVLEKLGKYKKELLDFVECGGTMLATCGGFSLLGKSYKTSDGEKEGLGVLDITTHIKENEKRLIGNVVLKSSVTDNYIVGFENHASRINTGTYKPLGEVVSGHGNDGQSGAEGVIYKNLVATNLHGPLLPKNPQLCDYILKNALKHKYSSFSKFENLNDELENLANNYIVQAYTR